MRFFLSALIAVFCVVANAAAWPLEDGFQLIPGMQTAYKIVNAGPPGAAFVEDGDAVSVHVLGKLRSTGKRFWSTLDDGPDALTYTVGHNFQGSLIDGWEYGVRGMLRGETRILNIPAAEGYGIIGFPAWGIPPSTDLILEIEVVSIKEGDAGDEDGEKLGTDIVDGRRVQENMRKFGDDNT